MHYVIELGVVAISFGFAVGVMSCRVVSCGILFFNGPSNGEVVCRPGRATHLLCTVQRNQATTATARMHWLAIGWLCTMLLWVADATLAKTFCGHSRTGSCCTGTGREESKKNISAGFCLSSAVGADMRLLRVGDVCRAWHLRWRMQAIAHGGGGPCSLGWFYVTSVSMYIPIPCPSLWGPFFCCVSMCLSREKCRLLTLPFCRVSGITKTTRQDSLDATSWTKNY